MSELSQALTPCGPGPVTGLGPCSQQENDRLSALARYRILDTPPDGAFDRIARRAAKVFATPIAIVSLVDEERIWFKARHGLEITQIARAPGLCASAILEDSPYVVVDANTDPRTLANPLVAGEFGLRFYAAAPLRTHDGHKLGTLCVIDREPRAPTPEQIAELEELAAMVMDQMELRLAARNAIEDLSEVVRQRDEALQRQKLLAREIEHRVMNSLLYISGLLDLQAKRSQSGDAAAGLQLAAGRVAAVARVHRHFYLDEAIERTCGLAYLTRLCSDLAASLGDVSLQVYGEPAQIATTAVMPLGLIVNELITNSAKAGAHAITVDFRPRPDGFHVSVTDDGSGLPSDFSVDQRTGLGLKVVNTLLRQLKGELRTGPGFGGRGARIEVRIPNARLTHGA